MALLAYDPDGVGRLHLSLTRALEQLRTVGCTDPAAAEAMRSVRRAASQVDQVWLPLVFRLLSTDPLSSAQRRNEHIHALDQSLIRVMAEGYGWAAQHDPLSDDVTRVTAEEARALGAMLNSVDELALANDPEQLLWLAGQLQIIGRDPALSSEFLANFVNWDILTYVLADQRVQSYRDDWRGNAVTQAIDAAFGGLMTVWRHSLPEQALHAGERASVASLLPPTQLGDPYVQALMLRALPLDSATLAAVTDELLLTWLARKHDLEPGSSMDQGVENGPNAADVLLPALLADPAAAVAFADRAVDHLDVLFDTLADPGIGYQVLLLATDPAHTTPLAAERVVVSVLRYFETDPYHPGMDTDGYPGTYGPFLGELVAPWLLQFLGSNTDWATDPDYRSPLLAIALRDDEALQRLTEATQRMAAGFARTLDGSSQQQAQQIGELLTMIGTLTVAQQVADADARPHAFSMLWTIGDLSTSLIKNPLVGIAAGAALGYVHDRLDDATTGPTAEQVRTTGEWTMDHVLTAAAANCLATLVLQWRAAGRVGATLAAPPTADPSTRCPSTHYLRDLRDWVATLPGGADGPLAEEAKELVTAFISGTSAQEHCS
ncbi:MAG: hypothetical protein Q7V88_06610 [Actinomycetota bacterium]|nr:hypothetical protein [Actinomycetota bacterium]